MSRNEWIAAGTVAAIGGIALAVWGILTNWDRSTSLAVAGLYVSVAGFALAITEVRKTATATKAAEGAIERTLRTITAERFLVTITRLRQSSTELDNAIADQHVERARRALNDWSDEASVCIGLVERRFQQEHGLLIASLRTVAESARETKSGLYSADQAVWTSTAECLQSIDKMTDRIGSLQEQIYHAAI